MTVQENVALAPLTTLGVGGPARWYVEARNEADVRDALAWARTRSVPSFVLGGGSNLVVADTGFEGMVVRPRIPGVEVREIDDVVEVTVGAGESWNAFVRHTVDNRWAGIECLAGIPGSVGAAPVQNIGAYGQEVSDTLARVRAWDREAGKVVNIPARECGFAYRASRFNGVDTGRFVILSATFTLVPGGHALVRYPDLRRHFEKMRGRPNLREVFDAVRTIRARKGMLLAPDDAESRSAGSFFKNPTLQVKAWAKLVEKAGDLEVPCFPQGDGTRKIPAAWLIETAGVRRGDAYGAVRVSRKHVLALVNEGGATASEVVEAARAIQSSVKAKWDIRLAPEPVFVGFAADAILPEGAIRAK
ncbi:MAG: UDP-N-acetylmuramate dehydrogenase [Armatimonadota bacterium]